MDATDDTIEGFIFSRNYYNNTKEDMGIGGCGLVIHNIQGTEENPMKLTFGNV